MAFFELPLCGGGTTIECGVHVGVKVGSRLVTIIMVCFNLFCVTFKPLRCLKDRLQVLKVPKACDPPC